MTAAMFQTKEQAMRDYHMETFFSLLKKFKKVDKRSFLVQHWAHLEVSPKVKIQTTHPKRNIRRRSFDFGTVNQRTHIEDQPVSFTDHTLGTRDIWVIDPVLQRYNPHLLAGVDHESTCLEVNNASITVRQYMTITNHGFAGWFEDAVLDMGFDFLRRMLKTDKYGVALCSTAEAKSLYDAHNNADSKKLELRELVAGRGSFDNMLIGRCRNAHFVILPISDGYQSDESRYEYKGTHWTVLVVDCRSRDFMQGHFMDSFPQTKESQQIANHVLCGLDMMFTHIDDAFEESPALVVEEHTPNQILHNKCGSDASGACGPFVFAFTNDITSHIIQQQKDGTGIISISIFIPETFKYVLNWDSNCTRQLLAGLVRRERTVRTYLCGTHEWFDKDGKKGWRNVLKDSKIKNGNGEEYSLPLDWCWFPWETSSSKFRKAISHQGYRTTLQGHPLD
ncbi:hypothetical protein GQ44DRAFT_761802 [Phaeosphaeriaceae sp. PMI808]|nr:hypothetical protein GQ44DRAFT_761802 [Phaeosphaeriaceae sp. PMI808]